MRCVRLAGVLLALAGCAAPPPEPEPTPGVAPAAEVAAQPEDTACCTPVADSVKLSPQEQCVVDVYRARCRTGVEKEGDSCIVSCLARDQGRNIGGGCWHLCFAYTGIRWTVPPGLAACDSLSPRRPGEKAGGKPGSKPNS